MKIQVVVHEAEEGGCWAEVPPLKVAPHKAKPSRNYCKTFTRQSKAVCLLPSNRRNPRTTIALSRLPSEAIRVRQLAKKRELTVPQIDALGSCLGYE